jgi:hypothetical protein
MQELQSSIMGPPTTATASLDSLVTGINVRLFFSQTHVGDALSFRLVCLFVYYQISQEIEPVHLNFLL